MMRGEILPENFDFEVEGRFRFAGGLEENIFPLDMPFGMTDTMGEPFMSAKDTGGVERFLDDFFLGCLGVEVESPNC